MVCRQGIRFETEALKLYIVGQSRSVGLVVLMSPGATTAAKGSARPVVW